MIYGVQRHTVITTISPIDDAPQQAIKSDVVSSTYVAYRLTVAVFGQRRLDNDSLRRGRTFEGFPGATFDIDTKMVLTYRLKLNRIAIR